MEELGRSSHQLGGKDCDVWPFHRRLSFLTRLPLVEAIHGDGVKVLIFSSSFACSDSCLITSSVHIDNMMVFC